MTDRRPGLKFALFSVACVVAAVWVFMVTGNYRELPFVTPTTAYAAELRDATGLRVGDDVRVSGVPVGRVEGLSVEQGVARVEFNLHDDVPVTDAWEAGPRWRNVTGQRYLYLYEREGGRPLEAGEALPVHQSRAAADIDRFLAEITPLLRAIDAEQQNKLLAALNTALDDREEQVQDLVRDLGSLTQTVADTEPQLAQMLEQGDVLLGEYNARSQELDAFITDLASVSDTLVDRNDEFLDAVADIGDVQERFGDLLRANDASIRGLVDDTETIFGSIDANLDEFERSVHSLPRGFATYMLISRWGEWFNVRAVALQAAVGDGWFCRTEGGTECDEANFGGQQTSSDPRSFAGNALGEREAGR